MSDVCLDYYESPVPEFEIHDLGIPTTDNTRWVMEFTPIGGVPDTRWRSLLPEIYKVYMERGDYKRSPDFEAWLYRLEHLLNESNTVLVMKVHDSGEVLAAASGFIGDNLHYRDTLMYATILNPTKDRKGLYKALQRAAEKMQVSAWCRSKYLGDGKFEVTFREV